ncbi:menin isoform X1 [Procambarus clarkii]|uniref:menin isoform X1 n=1 Tax=Procambarus clarkii TaxID=6728 RepID=UPI001E677AAA|nr:menin-like isoform X1 [Procambarus clarkii]
MAKLSGEERALFPLSDIEAVVNLFRLHLQKNREPNLAILSIIVGHIENTLTCSRGVSEPPLGGDDDHCRFADNHRILPVVEYETVEALHHRFLAIIKAHVDVTAFGTPRYATRELVKRISDVVWCTLSSSYYKDRAHLQSIYSYMTGAKLDSSGTTLAVVAACQALGYCDVHLALSEDHTWVVFGDKGQHTVEVTWHGKGNEDKRGIPVTHDVYSKSWLYVNGHPVVCDRHMEVATIVSNMNPGINATTDSEEVMLLQQALLWMLYDAGHLAKYPMAIDNLGDLEEMMPTKGRCPATKMYEEAITSAVRYYQNQHVYPYTYLGGYCYRNKLYKQALKYWARAASVIRNYNYSRDDEEIYKEFLEIANELIPHIMRVVSSGISARSILKDPECFGYLLEFYDGICEWEEGSATPVLHIGWAKALFNTIAKFEAHVRSHVKISCIDPDSTADISDVQEPPILEKSAAEARTSQDQNGNMATDCINITEEDIDPSEMMHRWPPVRLASAKMRGLRDLLLADKLNSQAISLQLTAQSQVTMTKKRGMGEVETAHVGRSKRARRE